MRLDALTLGAVAGELHAMLVGARLDPIIAPTPHAVAMECYREGRKRWLLLSAHPQLARVHLVAGKPTKLVAEPSAFVMLLRKYLESGRVAAVRWVPWERIIEIDVDLHGERSTLIAEVMGNLANIILVDDARRILGAVRHVSAAVTHYRAIAPGQPYLPPPTQTRTLGDATVPRLAPGGVDAGDLRTAAAQQPADPAWRVLAANVAGMSQDLAREVICRSAGDPLAALAADDERWEAVAAAVRGVAARAAAQAWAPVAIVDGDGSIADAALWPPCGVAPDRLRPAASVNDLLAEYFAAREWRDALGGAAGEVRRTLKTARERADRKLKALHGELDALAAADRLRAEGERLLTFASEIPSDAPHFIAPDLADGLGELVITLDPRLDAIGNANARFARYQKMRRAAQQIPPQIARAAAQQALIAQIQTDLDLADSLADIVQVRAELRDARLGRAADDAAPARPRPGPKGRPPVKGKPAPPAGGQPLKFAAPDGFTLYVGKNSRQNEYVTFTLATGSDLWLHARGVPGAHVIVKAAGRPIPAATLDRAASLAAWFSQSRGAASVPVDVTEQRYVRHMKDGGPGMVIYTHERTRPAAPKEP